MMNTIYTEKEYMEQGFTATEVPMIMEHDTLYNKWVKGGKVDTLMAERIAELAKELKL